MDGKRGKWIQERLQEANAHIHSPAERELKWKKMEESPFAFFRATCHLFYDDLAGDHLALPEDWKYKSDWETWICGDFHPGNIGFFHEADGSVSMDLNDFDEAYIGPFTWDLLRFLVGFMLMRKEVDCRVKKSKARELCGIFLSAWFDTLDEVSGNEKETLLRLTNENLTGLSGKTAIKIKEKPKMKERVEEWIFWKDGRPFLDHYHEKLGPVGEQYQALRSAFSHHFGPEKRPTNPLEFLDMARRLASGLGSLGLDKFYVLARDRQNKTVLLELKEQIAPNLLRARHKAASILYQRRFHHHALRNLLANRTMLLAPSNPWLSAIEVGEKSYLIRPVAPHRDGFEPKDFNKKKQIRNFLFFSGRLLALAHSRADFDQTESFIPHNFESSVLSQIQDQATFSERLIEIAEDYAKQVKRDHKWFAAEFEDDFLKS